MRTPIARLRRRLPSVAATVVAPLVLAACSGGVVVGAVTPASALRHLSHRAATAAEAPAAAAPAAPEPVAQPVTEAVPAPVPPTTAPPPAPVLAMGKLHRPDAMVFSTRSITDAEMARVLKIKGVEITEMADSGTADVGGAAAFALGVVPDSFRNVMPMATAKVDQLWSNLAIGGFGFSYDMAKERGLKLGGNIAAGPPGSAGGGPSRWISAFLSSGLPGVDVIVDHRLSADLALVPRSALVVSAPKADVWELQQALRKAVAGADVELLRAAPIVDTKATFLSQAQIATIISAATSRVGLPYLWGGTGPDAFDCSGLVGWSFRAAGLDVPRTAAQLYLAGPQIDPRRAQPGDLLFWANEPDAPGYVDHVAIYLGGGKMVVAPHTGDFVKISTVPANNFMGVVRLDPRVASRVGGPRYSALAARA